MQPLLRILAASLVLGLLGLIPTMHWRLQPRRQLDVLVLDYTVPFDNYREHKGLHWLLNHFKVPSPSGSAWRPTDYLGYHPTDREHPQRLVRHPEQPDLIAITDTYGVYRDDLLDPSGRIAHTDWNPLVFGGLTWLDASRLRAHSKAGGAVFAEFNTFADPTPPEARRLLEQLFGVRWTGWAGRIFVDTDNVLDMPEWLPRLYAEQNDGAELPPGPILVLAGFGRVEVFEGLLLRDLVPTTAVTPRGRRLHPHLGDGAPVFYWFDLVQATTADVHARLRFPSVPGLHAFFEELGVDAEPPLLAYRQATGAGPTWYLAAEFTDIDFDPGGYKRSDHIPRNRVLVSAGSGTTAAPAFWQFYGPLVRDVLDRLVAERGEP